MESKERPASGGAVNHYEKHLGYPDSCSVTYREENPVRCDSADISASGARCGLSAPTFIGGKFTCSADARVNADHSATVTLQRLEAQTVTLTCGYSATLVIDELVCEALEIDCRYSSTIHIKKLRAKTVSLNVIYSSTLRIDKGTIHFVKGLVDYASTGRSRAEIEESDVKVGHASTWDSQPG